MLLVIETAFTLSVALLDGTRIVAEVHRDVGRGHAEALMPAIAEVVGNDHARITGIVVDIGPGSFTGLRIGIAAARALGLAWGVPVTGVGSLTLIAAAAFAIDPALGGLTVAIDAGRGQVYWQAFSEGGIPMTPPAGAAHDGLRVTGPVANAAPRAASVQFVAAADRALPPVPLYLRAPDTALAAVAA